MCISNSRVHGLRSFCPSTQGSSRKHAYPLEAPLCVLDGTGVGQARAAVQDQVCGVGGGNGGERDGGINGSVPCSGTHLHKNVHTHKRVHTHTYIHTHIQTLSHTCTHTFIHTHPYTHTYMHIYTQTFEDGAARLHKAVGEELLRVPLGHSCVPEGRRRHVSQALMDEAGTRYTHPLERRVALFSMHVRSYPRQTPSTPARTCRRPDGLPPVPDLGRRPQARHVAARTQRQLGPLIQLGAVQVVVL